MGVGESMWYEVDVVVKEAHTLLFAPISIASDIITNNQNGL